MDDNLLIGTWNIRAFGDLTQKWATEKGDAPKRNLAGRPRDREHHLLL